MKEKREKTVGQLSQEILEKGPETDAIELEREIHKTYEDHIVECINRSKKNYSGGFYVVVETKKERLMQNVIRNYVFSRISCPTPTYDQTVYYYNKDLDKVDFLWVVPSKQTCEMLRANALQIDSSERQLLDYVLDFYDNTLLERAKILNKERKDSNIIEQ